MFFEKMFGNLFGMIWLIVFILGTLSLLVWMFVKKEKVAEVEEKQLIKEVYNDFIIEENNEGKFEVKNEEDITVKVFDNIEDSKMFVDVLLLRNESHDDIELKDSNYEIVEINGFFKVRKKGSERTLRKFVTIEEAQNYVKEKDSNDWSKINR